MSRSATATLTALGVGAAGELTEAPARALPVRGELAELLPWGGLRRGSTVSVRGSTSLLLALLAAATAEGCWAAVVGLPGCGALAAAELGVAVHRLALVPRPGRDQGEVGQTVAALLDGFDLVAVGTPVTPAASRKLSARARHRRAVLLPVSVPWPGADVELTATSGAWTGLSAGHGLLATRTLTVRATGRGAAARPRQTRLSLPATPAPATTSTPPTPVAIPTPPTPVTTPTPVTLSRPTPPAAPPPPTPRPAITSLPAPLPEPTRLPASSPGSSPASLPAPVRWSGPALPAPTSLPNPVEAV